MQLIFCRGVRAVFLILFLLGVRTPLPSQEAGEKTGETEERAFSRILNATPDTVEFVRKLERHLERFPDTPRRLRIYRTLLTRSAEIQDYEKALQYGEALYRATPEDRTLLLKLIELAQRRGRENHAKAIEYVGILVEEADRMAGERSSPHQNSEGPETMFASVAYMIRGQVYMRAGNNEQAEQDFRKSFSLRPTPEAAERLGRLALERNDSREALEQFATAFALPSESLNPAKRSRLRQKLGDLYTQLYGSEQGLGELLLARYDEMARRLSSRVSADGRPNAGVTDPFEFLLKRLDGGSVRLADYDGRVLVLDFWATWCGPCRTEGKLLEQVRGRHASQEDVTFLAVNTDEDISGVEDFVREEGWEIPVVYASGLDTFLNVRVIPTLMIFDRNRRVTFRLEGFHPATFVSTLEKKIQEALQRGIP